MACAAAGQLAAIALSPEFAGASGKYYDNDAGGFGDPHPDALDGGKVRAVIDAIEAVLERLEKHAEG